MIHSLIKPVLVLFFLSLVQLYAQSFTVSGTVLNEKGQPLIGANVFIDGTALGSATDIEGNYQIKKIPSGKKYTITAMFIGHRTMTKEIIDADKALIKIDFELVMSLVDLDSLGKACIALGGLIPPLPHAPLVFKIDLPKLNK